MRPDTRQAGLALATEAEMMEEQATEQLY